jgi:hypothetical protein
MRLSLNGGASWPTKSNGAKTLEGVRALYANQTLIAQRPAGEDLRDHRQNEGVYTIPKLPKTRIMYNSKSRLQSLTKYPPPLPRATEHSRV